MVVLYCVLGLLLFLLLPMCFPVGVRLGFREEFQLELRYLWFRLPLLPAEEEESQPSAPEPEEEKPPKKEKKANKRSFGDRVKAAFKREGPSGFLETLGEMARLAGRVSANLLRHVKLRQFDLYLCIGGGTDAAAAAVRYGQASAAVYGACGELFALMPCKEKGVTVDLDYSAAEHQVEFSAALSLRPIFLLTAGIALLVRGLPLLRRVT